VNVAALVLAAGRGSRFGESPKLLAPLDGQPLVRHVAQAALASRAGGRVLAVTGHAAEAIEGALAGLPVETLRNPDYAAGLSTSLRAGFAALSGSADAVVVLLADMPRVTPALVDRLIGPWETERPPAVVPVAGGRRGNPVLLSAALAPAIAALTGDTGAGALLRGLAGVREVPVEDDAALADVDTPDALAALPSPIRERGEA
jgi:molybdenum cofactor cytidylyltransferase